MLKCLLCNLIEFLFTFQAKSVVCVITIKISPFLFFLMPKKCGFISRGMQCFICGAGHWNYMIERMVL